MADVEVVYCPEGKPVFHQKQVFRVGMTVLDVLKASELWKLYPEAEGLSVGVFARPVTLDTVLTAGARVEVYRPLLIDPKEKRRRRAKGT